MQRKVLEALGYKTEKREALPDLPSSDPEVDSKTETATIDKAPDLAVEVKGEDTKTKIDTLPTPAAETKAAPEKVVEIVTATPRKPKKSKTLSLYNERVQDEDGTTREVANKDVWLIPARGQKGFNPKGHNRSKNQFKGKKNTHQNKGRNTSKGGHSNSPKKAPAFNKNSPFAALAALKSGDTKKDGDKN